MKSIKIDGKNGKWILAGVQILIVLAAAAGWLVNRGNAYERTFDVHEFQISEEAQALETVYIDDTAGGAGVLLSVPGLSLDRGIYHIQIDYRANSAGNTVSALAGPGGAMEDLFTMELSPASNSAVMPVEVTRAGEDAVIQVSFSGKGYLDIIQIGIYETSGLYKKRIVYALLLCLLLELGYFFRQADVGRRKVMLALAGIFVAACYPLYMNYMVVGHDLPFHLLRIDAISQGLASGVFPVKIHPFWARGQGYAAGIFYGDTFLYFPALLRLAGFSVQSAYKIFVAAVNMGTVLCSYYAFRKMFSGEKTGLLGCAVYTLAPYRLMDVYTRASVGEYTAMMTMPLILCGFYLLLKNREPKGWFRYSALTAVGLWGVIQSHVLSSLMTAFVIVLFCILLIRQIFRKYVFRGLVCAAGLTVIFNLNFIVPFLDFYREDVMINSPDWTGSTVGSFQAGGLFPIQLFTLFQRSNGGAWAASAGIYNEPSLGIGIMLTAGMGLFIYLLCICRQECKKDVFRYRAAVLCMLVGCVLLYMCTCYFPWNAIAAAGPQAKDIVYSLEFPWRLLAPATVLLTFVLCYSFERAGRVMTEHFPMVLTGCLILFAVNCGWYFYDYAFTGQPYRVYASHELNTMQMYSCDYLPAGTDPEAIAENAVRAEGAELDEYQKQGTNISCRVWADPEGGYVEFPLLYYKYYRCMDADTSQVLPVSAGTNNVIRVDLPEGYAGSISLGFREPWFWRLAEWISVLALGGTAVFIWGEGRKKDRRSRRTAGMGRMKKEKTE